MKKIFTSLLLGGMLVGLHTTMSAAPGDTTTVISHNTQMLDWYGNFDSIATFPDGTTSYKRVMMEFELGKYLCDGYDPSNAGEGASQTGWCGDWDYDVHVIAMTSTGDTIELGEIITPYANSTFPATAGWDWKHSYMFDVTDYYPILKDDVTIRIFYSGYSGGFTASMKFHFVEGTRARDVVGIQKLYHGSYAYGLATNPIESNVAELTLNFPATAESGIFRTIITGHGGISGSNCSEFCKKWMKYQVNGTDILTKYIWRDDCGSNWLAVQSGTWIYDRANWCPGNLVDPWIVPIPASVLPGSSYTADINFQPFTASGEGASYKMSTYAIYYGPYNITVDAGIEDIIIPNSKQEMRLENAACGIAKIKVKNFGSTTITSIKLAYKIGAGTASTKVITTAIAPEQTAEILIEDFNELNTVSGTNTFYAEIVEVNGIEDEDEYNDKMSSAFNAVPQHAFNNFNITLKTSGNTKSSDKATWEIIDMATGEVVVTRSGTVKNTTLSDSFNLDKGCYKLVVSTSGGNGLAFFSAFAKGYVRLYNTASGARIPMPGNDMGSTGLEGNFGNGFTYYFVVTTPSSVDEIAKNMIVNVFPNPANESINIELNVERIKDAKVTMINAIGEVVYTQSIQDKNTIIATSAFPAGLYLLEIENNGNKRIEKVSIIR